MTVLLCVIACLVVAGASSAATFWYEEWRFAKLADEIINEIEDQVRGTISALE